MSGQPKFFIYPYPGSWRTGEDTPALLQDFGKTHIEIVETFLYLGSTVASSLSLWTQRCPAGLENHHLGFERLPVVSHLELESALGDGQKDFICAVIKQKDTDSVLETLASQLKEKTSFENIIVGALNHSHDSRSRYLALAYNDASPVLRCYLGRLVIKDFSGSLSLENIAQWITHMKRKYGHQWRDGVSTINSAIDSHDVTLIALPTHERVPDIDLILSEVQQKLKKRCTVKSITIHPNSQQKSSISQHFAVTGQSAVMAFVRADYKGKAKKIIFQKQDINPKKITSTVIAHLQGIKHLNVTNFETETLTVRMTERFRPYIVAFYAWWANHVDGFLTLLESTIREFQNASLMVRFALVNVGEEKRVISRYIDVDHFKFIPFIAVFQREKGKDTVNQTILNIDHPSPYYLTQALQNKGIWLQDVWGNAWQCSPYKILDHTHYCSMEEGPWGEVCTAWASNQTDSDRPSMQTARKAKAKRTTLKSLSKLMPKSEGVPVMSQALWDAVMERSEIKAHAYYWQREVRVTLLAFVKDGCGSCAQKMETFREIYQELQRSDNGDLFLVNCSREMKLCQSLEVQGFPSAMAFRSFATLLVPNCELSASQKPYVRRDYHGPIATGEIIKWLEELSRSSLSDLKFQEPGPLTDMEENVRLIATIIPKRTQYLPLAPRHDRNYFYPLSCFRVICEHLFGLSSCLIAYSKDLPQTEFDGVQNEHMIVSQIVFERKDGVSLKIMTLTRPLLALLEDETGTKLHLFHHPHQYALSPNQKCEDNHQICTQVLAAFTQDHVRLPVTHLTSEIFHTKHNHLFEDERPVLIGLGHKENITESSVFMQLLQEVAAHMYKDIIVTVMDVDLYPAWAGNFVPKDYYRKYADTESAGPLHIYPRICLVDWHDHSHAAFYPPVHMLEEPADARDDSTTDHSGNNSEIHGNKLTAWGKNELISHVKKYLSDPESLKVQTEHF